MKHFCKELSDKLEKHYGTVDFINVDFKEIPDDKQVTMNFKNARNVRMSMGKVMTPYDVKMLVERVLSKKLPF